MTELTARQWAALDAIAIGEPPDGRISVPNAIADAMKVIREQAGALRAVGGVSYRPAPPVGYVVVTVAPNGVVHAYGADDGTPLSNRAKAATLRAQLAVTDALLYPEAVEPVRRVVCKVLGDPNRNEREDSVHGG